MKTFGVQSMNELSTIKEQQFCNTTFRALMTRNEQAFPMTLRLVKVSQGLLTTPLNSRMTGLQTSMR
jgi:predicted Zn-dependent protease